MRPAYAIGCVLVPALVALSTPTPVNAVPSPATGDALSIPNLVVHDLQRRDEHGGHHGHNPNAPPKTELNETEVMMGHDPIPPSYWTHDFEGDHAENEKTYPGLMGLHITLMSLAFFGALPAGIALRSVKHAWHGLTVIAFWTLCVLGCASSALYRKLTPNLYEHEKHSSQGYFWLFLAALLSAVDFLALALRLYNYIKSVRSGVEYFSIKKFWRHVILGQEDEFSGSGKHLSAEYTGLVEEPEEYDMQAVEVEADSLDDGADANNYRHHRSYPSASSERTMFGGLHSPTRSTHSDETLHDLGLHVLEPKSPLAKRIGKGVFATLERTLVFAGFGQLLSGIVVYTGGCRESFVNNCLAHLIKGGIFWCYGLVTFARFLGSFSELGWAWNRAPRPDKRIWTPSAEFVESAVICFYGLTNTWMERFGAKPGDPYSTKQVQHISIAVMFWFAGLAGMGLESRRVRRWLAAASTAAVVPSANGNEGGKGNTQEAVAEPPSYIASFNPFPALVIGVTGVAMSAHFQVYLFQVQIHALWGYLLSAFTACRFLTYFFLWLGPPRSILPSRPPTEVLASFFLACGGLVFMFSTEEVTYAAMRRGRDDVMMFLNVAVAITCFCFCWTMGVVAFKGWLKSRTHVAVQFHSSA